VQEVHAPALLLTSEALSIVYLWSRWCGCSVSGIGLHCVSDSPPSKAPSGILVQKKIFDIIKNNNDIIYN
jgi:hypothetical protein